MADTFNCPNCGAPLDYHGTDPMIRCPYCNSSVVVPDNLRSTPSFSSRASNFTLTGLNAGNLGALVQKAQRLKEVRDLARAGQVDRAVQIYSEVTGVAPDMARLAVEALGRGQPIVLSNPEAMAGIEAGLERMSAGLAAMDAGVAQIDPGVAEAETVAAVQNAAKTTSRLGCLIGCFVGAIVLFVVGIVAVTVVVPMVAVGNASIGPMSTLAALPTELAQVGAPDTPDLSVGAKGKGPGMFGDVRAVAANPSTGAIFVAEYEGGLIQAFDPAGNYLSQWTVGGKNTLIFAMAADHKGNIFVVGEDKIYRYDNKGKLRASFSVKDTNIRKLVVAADGSLLVADDADNILRLTADGKQLASLPDIVVSAGGDEDSEISMAIDGVGNLYVLSPQNNAVFKFTLDGKFVNRFGGEGEDPGNFSSPETIAVDNQGRVFVSDFKGVQVFDGNGRYLRVVRVNGYIYGLAFDDKNNLYVTSSDEKVLKFAIPNTPE